MLIEGRGSLHRALINYNWLIYKSIAEEIITNIKEFRKHTTNNINIIPKSQKTFNRLNIVTSKYFIKIH